MLRVLLDAFIFVMIYADDLHLCSAGKERPVDGAGPLRDAGHFFRCSEVARGLAS